MRIDLESPPLSHSRSVFHADAKETHVDPPIPSAAEMFRAHSSTWNLSTIEKWFAERFRDAKQDPELVGLLTVQRVGLGKSWIFRCMLASREVPGDKGIPWLLSWQAMCSNEKYFNFMLECFDPMAWEDAYTVDSDEYRSDTNSEEMIGEYAHRTQLQQWRTEPRRKQAGTERPVAHVPAREMIRHYRRCKKERRRRQDVIP
jgi:hypothetical protein